jgi:beta-glucosidase
MNSSLSRAIENGTIPSERLDDMVTRIVSAWYKVGQNDNFPVLDVNRNALNASRNEVLREIGAKSIVLLKNEGGALPLGSGGYISVFGQASSECVAVQSLGPC